MRTSTMMTIWVAAAASAVAGCPGSTEGSKSHAVGGTVSGLSGVLVLQNELADDLTVTEDGPFAFAARHPDGATFAVTIKSAPPRQSCSVSAGSGRISGADVTTVTVVCVSYNLMFATSTTHDGAFGGLAGADGVCAARAAAAGLAGTYLAYLSTFLPGGGLDAADLACQDAAAAAGLSGRTFKALLATEASSAASRFSTSGATWVRPDGIPIVATAAGLATEALDAPINVALDGTYLGNYGVWSGAASLAVAGSSSTCSDWSSSLSSDAGRVGIAAETAIGGYAPTACDQSFPRIQCLEE